MSETSSQESSTDEARLRRAQEMQSTYEAALASTPDFVYVFGLDKRFIYANKSLLDMWGRDTANAFGKSLTELGYPDWHVEMHEREIDQVLETKKAIRGIVPFTGTNGRRIYDYIFAPVFDEYGIITSISGTTRDVTERFEAEEALKRSEEQRQVTLNATEFVGTWTWDLKTNLVIADERFARLYSVDPKLAAIGAPLENYTKFIHPDDIEQVGEAIQKTLATGDRFAEEYRLIQSNGSVRWVVARGRVYTDENDQPNTFTGVVIDITDRKNAEEQRQQSQLRYQTLFNSIQQGFCVIEIIYKDGKPVDYRYSETNPAFEKQTGFKNPVGKTANQCAPHEDHWAKIYAEVAQTGEAMRFTNRVAALNRWYDVHAFRLDGDDNRVAVLFDDITERKIIEIKLKESQQHLSLMVESAQDYGIISLDIDGKIISWSNGAERIFGYKASEAIGQSIEIIFTPEDHEHNVSQSEIETATTSGRSSDERWHIRKNGERFYASGIMASMKNDKGEVKGFIKIARDMTKEQVAQQDLIAARNAAEAANIAKTEFLANMSHEIRTPMNAVIGLSNILAMSQPLSIKQKEFIKTLQMSADSLLALINDLLDIAKIEARTVDLEKVPFSLAQLIQEVNSMIGVRAGEKNLQLTGETECVDNRVFIGDPTRLRQIILNLCSNAVKFTESGSIHVSVTRHPEKGSKFETVCIIIKDTGIGIAPEQAQTIFHKFVQADASINRKYGGTGLGLAITKTLTEIMGGTISVESELGVGSTFKVCLPLELADEVEIQTFSLALSDVIESRTSNKLCILLVEDYAPNVMVASIFLQEFGYICDVANNGIEAVEKVKTNNYAAILMDVQMHGMNGLEATRLIRAYEQQSGKTPTPIIGMTAHALAGDYERCISVGMDDYLSKPFNPLDLKSKIIKAITPE